MAGWVLRTARGVAVATAVVTVLAGCGGNDEEPTETMESGPSAAAVKPADGTPASMVLTKAELPLGTAVVPVNPAMIAKAAQSLNSPDQAQAGAKVSPAECASQTVLVDSVEVDAAKLGLMQAKAGTGAISEVVLGQRIDIPAIKTKLTRTCATVTVSAAKAAPSTAAAKSVEIAYKAVPVPKTAGQAFAAQETVTQGEKVAQRSITGWARVGDRSVIVKATSASGAEVDKAYFDQVFVTAVEKVAKSK